MKGRPVHHLSLFSQNLDRVAFLAYFLGAVVPLAAAGLVVQRFALPQLEGRAWEIGALAGLICMGALSLAAFLALRRVTRQTLVHVDRENRRLENLLQVSGKLSDARFADEVNRTVAACAAQLTEAPLAWVLARDPAKPEDPAQIVASAGESAVEAFRAAQGRVCEVVEPVLAQGVPALWQARGADDPADAARLRALAAVPIAGGAGLPPAALVVAALPADGAFDASHLRLLDSVAALAGVARANADLRDAQRNFFVHVTEMLMAALDAHVDEQAGHARRVAHLSVVMGRELGFDDHRLERLHFAALLHDVGMLKLDTRRPQERSSWRRHAQLGHRMLLRIRLWEDLAEMVLHHHEWWNGGGYPEGLQGEDIPLESRVIGLAEAFDSMTSRSSYQRALGFEEALAEIETHAGTQFDPRVARIFLDLARRGVIEGQKDG